MKAFKEEYNKYGVEGDAAEKERKALPNEIREVY
jgi:hypothetical protein